MLYNAAGDGEQGREMRTLIQVLGVLLVGLLVVGVHGKVALSNKYYIIIAGRLPGQRHPAHPGHLHEQVLHR